MSIDNSTQRSQGFWNQLGDTFLQSVEQSHIIPQTLAAATAYLGPKQSNSVITGGVAYPANDAYSANAGSPPLLGGPPASFQTGYQKVVYGGPPGYVENQDGTISYPPTGPQYVQRHYPPANSAPANSGVKNDYTVWAIGGVAALVLVIGVVRLGGR